MESSDETRRSVRYLNAESAVETDPFVEQGLLGVYWLKARAPE
jgi:hypothetical protein